MRPSLASTVLTLAASASLSLAAKAKQAAAEDNPDDPTGKILYITEPACGFYRCTVTWNIGEQVAVNWLGPPGGDVSVSLQSNIGGPTYPIVDKIAGTSQEGYCDAGYGLGTVAPGHECGRVEFIVPSGWEKMDNYTIVVQSLSDANAVGYTDMITIAAANSSSAESNAPSGSSASLVQIPAPTATNAGASTRYTGSIPSPTAGNAAPSSSSRSASINSVARSVSTRDAASSTSGIASSTASSMSLSTAPSAASAGTSQSARPTSGAVTRTASTVVALGAAAIGALWHF